MNASPFPPISPLERVNRFFAALPPVTAWLLKANIALYLLFLFGELIHSRILAGLYASLALSSNLLSTHHYWQPLTYMFLHGGFLHLLFNMLTLRFLGPETERSMGSAHFLAMYLIAGILGGLGWLWLTPQNALSICVGASGALFGVMAAFATLFPRRRLTFFIFIFPVTADAWKAVLGIAVVQLFLLHSGPASNIAYSAHLFGALAGFLYIDRLYESALFRRLLSRIRDYFSRTPHAPYVPPAQKDAQKPSPEEIDRILDKISREGIQSLTREERQTLHRASSSI